MIPLPMTEGALGPQTQPMTPGETPPIEGENDFADMVDLLRPPTTDEGVLVADTEDLPWALVDGVLDADVEEPLPHTDKGDAAAPAGEGEVAEDDVAIELVMAEPNTVEKLPVADRVPLPDAVQKQRPVAIIPKAADAAEDMAQQPPRTTERPAAIPAGAMTFAQTVVEGRFPVAMSALQPTPEPEDAVPMAVATAEVPKPVVTTGGQQVTQLVTPNPDNVKIATHELPGAMPKEFLEREREPARDVMPRDTRATSNVPATPNAAAAATTVPVKAIDAEANVKGGVQVEPLSDIVTGLVGGERGVSAPQLQTTTAAPPTAGAETARQVASQIAVAISGQQGRVTEIALNPEELGRVRLSMTAVDATITLNVLAERPETNDLLRRHIDTLAQEFRALGYDDISFSFGGENQTNADAQSDGGFTGDPADLDASEMQSETRQTAVTGLDLRI